ncbi:MAG: M20/M25/M40 family metallo-hydrolase, partial [Hyphomicrobiales bacterium]
MTSAIDHLERLIGFDTVSRNSNLELIDYVRAELAGLGVESQLVASADGHKANLFATIGPTDRPGVVLSGHTDVVPCEGQAWTSDPFAVRRDNGRLYGRGTADMKGFIACCLAMAPEAVGRRLATPIHFAFSYDEEVGCIGVRRLLDEIAEAPVKPRFCIVGEPTLMQVATAHKGKAAWRVVAHGLE